MFTYTEEQLRTLVSTAGGRQMVETEMQNTEAARASAEAQAGRSDPEQAARLNSYAVQLASEAARMRNALAMSGGHTVETNGVQVARGGIGDAFKMAAGVIAKR